MLLSIMILSFILLLIAIRQIGNLKFQIWQIMFVGAIAVYLFGQISLNDALKSINIEVMIFLFCMFMIGVALEESGYLSYLSYKLFGKSKSMDSLILIILFGFGILSAFLMNDTIAIIGTPVMFLLAKKNKINPKILLIVLAFSVTIGSVMSPIGNPQNLLIAINGNVPAPFFTFLKFLFIPTLINLFLAFFIIKIYYRKDFNISLDHSPGQIKDNRLAVLSKISLISLMCFVLIKIIIGLFKIDFEFRMIYISLISVLPILFSKKRFSIIKKIDWHTLIFFASMFIVMQSVWNSGFSQSIINSLDYEINSSHFILIVSILLSQVLSNVPLVALYLPVLINNGVSTAGMMALAAGSTIAGNLFIIGAASNIIIIQNAEKKYHETITFWEFARIGIPLTIINVLVYWIFLVVL